MFGSFFCHFFSQIIFGFPPHTHTFPPHTLPPMGGSLSPRRLCKICRDSMKQNPLKCKGVWKVRGWNPKKIYPLGWKTLCLGKQKFASEFFCPWHNVSSQKEHTFDLWTKFAIFLKHCQRWPQKATVWNKVIISPSFPLKNKNICST